MDTGAAFLAALAADPGDDTARLAFADWLEEGGGPRERARAEFIRLQCGLGDPATRAARADELEREHRAAWDGPFAPLRGTVEYQRGFPYRLHAPLDRLVEHQELLGLAPEWDLHPTRPPGTSAALCARFAVGPFADRVAGLSLAALGWEPEELRALLAPPLGGRLRRLAVAPGGLFGQRDPGGTNPTALLEVLVAATAPRLEGLLVRGHPFGRIGDEGCRLLAGAAQLGTLTGLWLPDCGITAAGLEALAGCPHLARLRTLDLECNQVPLPPDDSQNPWLQRFEPLGDAGPAVLAGAAVFRRLTTLRLMSNAVTDLGVRALLGSPHLASVSALNLALNDLSDDTLVAVAESDGLPALTWLNVSAGHRQRITGAGVARLVDSPRMARLTGLKLGSQPIGDDGALALAASPNCRNLTELHVGGCGIGPRAFARLLDSPHLAGVTEFSARCNRLTDAEVADLRARHPGRVA